MPFNPRRYNGVTPVDPSTLPSIEVRLETDSGMFTDGVAPVVGTTPAGVGDSVQQWVDQENGHIFQQLVGGNKSTVVTDDVIPYNAMNFAVASDQHLICTTLPSSIKTVIAVHVPLTFNGNKTIVGADTSDPVGIGAFYLKSADNATSTAGMVFAEDGGGSFDAGEALNGSFDSTVWNVYGGRADSVAKEVSFYKGQALISTDSFVGDIRPVGDAGAAIGAGFFNENDVDHYDGKVAAVYMFNDTLTEEEYQGVVAFIEARYNIAPSGDYIGMFFNKLDPEARLYATQGSNGIDFKNRPINHFKDPATLGVRDPDIYYDTVADKFFICHTNADDPADECTDFVILESTDLISWSHVTYVDCSSIANGILNYTWAPQWFRDPADNKLYVLVSITPDGNPVGSGGTPFGGYYVECLNPGTCTSWGLPVLLDTPDIQAPEAGGGYSGAIDWICQVIGGTYYMFYKDEAATTKYIYYATSTSLGGTFTSQVGPYATPPGPSDWAGWGDNLEGQHLLKLPNDDWRMYLDQLGNTYYYSDSSDTFATWTPLATISDDFASGNIQHGSVIILPGIDPFGFTSQTDVALNTLIQSNTITPTGEVGTYSISIEDGEYSIDGGAFTSAPGTFTLGSTVAVNQVSAPTPSTLTTASLLIGGTVGEFDVTTVAPSIPIKINHLRTQGIL